MTLLELVVALALTTIVVAVLSGIFVAQGRYFALQDAVAETQVHAARILDTAGLFLSSADSVVTSWTVNGRAYVSGTDTLIVRLPAIDASGDLVAGSYDYLALGLDPDDRSRFMYDLQAGAGSTRIGGKFVKGLFVDKLIFRYNTVSLADAKIINLFVRTTRTAYGRKILTPFGRAYYLGTN